MLELNSYISLHSSVYYRGRVVFRRSVIACLTFILCGGLLLSCTHQFDGVEDNTPSGNLECLWSTIDQKYCFHGEKYVDWSAIHARYSDEARSLKQDDYLALFDLCESMLNTLNDGHVNLYSPFDLSSCSNWYEGFPDNFNANLLAQHYLLGARKAGVAYYTTMSGGEVGYIYCGSFESMISSANMAYILHSFLGCKGLIVDVRNNGGGSMEYAKSLASTFFKETQVVGYWQHKSGPNHDDFSPLEEMKIDTEVMPSRWLRPVVVLCNRHSYSSANFFVSAMRYAYDCTIIGGVSGGGGGMPLSYELPNGWIVRFSSVRILDKDGHSIEGGVVPDILINAPCQDTDEMIEYALQYIHTL